LRSECWIFFPGFLEHGGYISVNSVDAFGFGRGLEQFGNILVAFRRGTLGEIGVFLVSLALTSKGIVQIIYGL